MKGKIALALILCAAAARAQDITGKVAETMDSGGYTYARVVRDGNSTWVAAPTMKLKEGDAVSFQQGMVMDHFKSPTLNRTFDKIVFSGGVSGGEAPAAGKGGGKGVGTPTATKAGAIKVDKAPGGLSVAEVYAQREKLSGQKVVVRGKVTKVNKGIMNRNWVHLQDGTGTAKKADFDLLVTTSEEAQVGETVTAQGTLAKDLDFGMGYKYVVLIEKATLAR